MTTNPNAATAITRSSDTELVITRVFDAPRPLVWKAWTTSEHLAQWWSPDGWTVPVSHMDFRVGGSWEYCMRGPEGEESCGKTVYHEIAEPERIVSTDYFADSEGNLIEGMPAATATIEFVEQNGKTLLSNKVQYQTAESLDQVIAMGMQEGIQENMNHLAAFLQAQQA